MNGLKEKITLRGVDTDVYKKTISGGYLFDGESPKEAYHRESVKQLLVDYSNQKWQKHSSSIFGTVGFVLLALFYLTLVLTGVAY